MTLSNPAAGPVTVTLGFGGSATFGTDYTVTDQDPATPGVQIVIPAGATTGSVNLSVTNDGVGEPAENITIEITAISGATEVGGNQVTSGTIAGSATTGPSGAQPTVVPTLNQWMLMLLGLLLPATLVGRLRGQNRKASTHS